MALDFPAIDPVALAIGPLEIRWYALAYLAGFLLGWYYGLYLARLDEDKKPPEKYISCETIDDFLPWAILAVILGGRMGYVIFYQPGLYAADPLEIFKVWHGGMSFHGGAAGVIVAMLGYSALKKKPFLRLADIVCCAVPIGLFFGRIANFVNGELYGRAANVPWAFVFPRGGDMPRHPSQLYEAFLEGAVLFAILFLLARCAAVRNMPGVISGAFLALYGVFRMAVEFFREPDVQIGFLAGGWTMGQLLCVPMVLAGLGVMFFSVRAARMKAA